jgi:general nucleoside transport system ATP-binding protein
MQATEAVIALEMRAITKRFPGVLANDAISFDLRKGEIHALLGENGAGKSTLMNILYGLYQPDSGEILLDGKLVKISNPRVAIASGIGMVHQHFMLVPTLTVAENITLGQEEQRGAFLDLQKPTERILDIAKRYGLEIEPGAYVKDLSVGLQQRVEIVKALYRNAQVLVLDEPTAVLTPLEVTHLFETLRTLTAQGVSIIFITHKLKEVQAVANRITVLRQGRVVGTTTPHEATESSLAAMMVGRSVLLKVDKEAAQPKAVVLQVHDLTVMSDRKQVAVHHLSFNVQAGEILGIAGVEGNGQTELIEAITGLRPHNSGEVLINQQPLTNNNPHALIEAGGAHIPENRHKYGMVAGYSLAYNFVLSTIDRAPFTKGATLDEKAIAENAQHLIEEFDVRTPSAKTTIGSLSGGNQQKAVVAREFSRPIKLLIAAQPTRGVDVGSIEFIHKRIIAARDSGVAVLLVSAELDEVMSLSDRVLVMFKGQIVGEKDATATREELGLLMMGKA